MLTEKYDFRITDQMTIPLRPHWIANDSYREKCISGFQKQASLPQVPEFTIGMLIASARSGRWLYD